MNKYPTFVGIIHIDTRGRWLFGQNDNKNGFSGGNKCMQSENKTGFTEAFVHIELYVFLFYTYLGRPAVGSLFHYSNMLDRAAFPS